MYTEHFDERWGKTTTSPLRHWWAGHHVLVLRLVVVLMAVLAVLKLGDEFRRLLWEPGYLGAIDLKQRYSEVHYWFAGKPVYGELGSATYPPASYVLLWPFLGWLTLTQARWLWAVTTVAALAQLIYLVMRESEASTRLERVFVALMPLSMNATGVAIGNGQLIVHLLCVFLTGIVLMRRERRRWYEESLAIVLILAALVKPSVTIPFFWLVLFIPGKLRLALVIGFGYIALTLFAASFQQYGVVSLLGDWTTQALRTAGQASVENYGSVHSWLHALGMEKWNFVSSLLVLSALGFWIYRHRYQDLWLLLGVTALIARCWTHHGLYDDLLIVVPMVALFRIAKRGSSPDETDATASVLLVITTLTMLLPARMYFLWPPPWPWLFAGGHVIVWMAVLVFLLSHCRCSESRERRLCAAA